MTRVACNSTLLKRVANVTVVALSMVCSLVLIGAVHADWSVDHKPAPTVEKRPAAVHAHVTPARTAAAAELGGRAGDAADAAELASVKIPAAEVELLEDAAPAPAATDAVTLAPRTRVVRMEVTAYCPCTRCCGPGAQGITASGKLVDYNGGKFVAADTRLLPFGSRLSIPGYADNAPVEVIDRGGAIKGHKLDLYFPTHAEALLWGRQHVDVTVYE
jgi:3D (Asp-Asp-Asp) domain-containing protein